jgi:hypothetical protein
MWSCIVGWKGALNAPHLGGTTIIQDPKRPQKGPKRGHHLLMDFSYGLFICQNWSTLPCNHCYQTFHMIHKHGSKHMESHEK